MCASVTLCNINLAYLVYYAVYAMNIWRNDVMSATISASATDAVTKYFLKSWKPFAMYPIFMVIIATFNFPN